jgi:hypothetical protein
VEVIKSSLLLKSKFPGISEILILCKHFFQAGSDRDGFAIFEGEPWLCQLWTVSPSAAPELLILYSLSSLCREQGTVASVLLIDSRVPWLVAL